jgi:glucose/arabinose dehydrogenase
VVKGLKEPTFTSGPPDGSNRLFVLEREGTIRVANADGQLQASPLLDLSGEVSTGGEEGLLSLAFHPQFAQNGFMYVAYTANDWSLHVVRYTLSADAPNVVDPGTAAPVLVVPKKSKYHNGGMLAFGPDGYLYVAVGDDEASDRAQDLSTLVGKILRLDVDSAAPYAVPASNPFVEREGARGEIWAYGFRNPWRISFDRATGDLWMADVGDARWEEVDFQPAASAGGENYGWPMNEGTECVEAEHCHDGGLVAPVVTYGHDMNCSVSGGYVYRGKAVPGLVGSYIFGDLCTGGVFTIRHQGDQPATRLELGFSPIKISSFGEDPAGELYVCDMQGGVVYRIVEGSVP